VIKDLAKGSYERQNSRQRLFDNVLQISVTRAAGLTAFAAAIESWPRWAIVLPAVISYGAMPLVTSAALDQIMLPGNCSIQDTPTLRENGER
jgi:hypothetical protein